MKRLSRLIALASLVVAVLAGGPVHAAAFGVSPIRVDLDPSARSGLVTVANDEDRTLRFQVKLRRWTQDASGTDQYADSDDLVYFPQMLTLAPKEKRVVRIGLKAPPSQPEAAYRLYIEEMPEPSAGAAQGAQVNIRLRFGVPVFVNAKDGKARAEVATIDMAKGAIEVSVRNDGERHVRIEEIVARSAGRDIGKVAGWYVFPGATRKFSIPVAAKECPASGSVDLVATGESGETRASAQVSPQLCGS